MDEKNERAVWDQLLKVEFPYDGWTLHFFFNLWLTHLKIGLQAAQGSIFLHGTQISLLTPLQWAGWQYIHLIILALNQRWPCWSATMATWGVSRAIKITGQASSWSLQKRDDDTESLHFSFLCVGFGELPWSSDLERLLLWFRPFRFINSSLKIYLTCFKKWWWINSDFVVSSDSDWKPIVQFFNHNAAFAHFFKSRKTSLTLG